MTMRGVVACCWLVSAEFVCLCPNLSSTKMGFSGCLGVSTGVPVKQNKQANRIAWPSIHGFFSGVGLVLTGRKRGRRV